MTHRVSGPFDVTMTPEPDAFPGRRRLDKRYHGALDASAEGQMLAFMHPTLGSGGYVAIERVTGTLEGREGSFVLQHNATMDRSKPSLSIIGLEDHVGGCVRTAAEHGNADQYVDEVIDVVRRTLGRPVRSSTRST